MWLDRAEEERLWPGLQLSAQFGFRYETKFGEFRLGTRQGKSFVRLSLIHGGDKIYNATSAISPRIEVARTDKRKLSYLLYS